MPSIYSTPTGFVIALLLKAWWTESLTVPIVPYIRRREHHAVMVQGWPAVLVLPLGNPLPFWITGDYLFPSSCHKPAAVWGTVGLWQLPQSCRHLLQSHCFLGRQNPRLSHLLPLSPDSYACLHHTLPYSPWVQQSTVAVLTECTIP